MKQRKKITTKTLWLMIFVVLVVLIKIISLYPLWTEKFYTAEFFKGISIFLRTITGWLPFSFGDILYLLAGLWLVFKIVKFFINLFKKRMTWRKFGAGLFQLLLICFCIYIVFNIFWGLNYNRKGIAWQLNLAAAKYDSADLKNIQQLLLQKVNESKQALVKQNAAYPSNKELFARAKACYRECEKQYSFLDYSHGSIKSSLYGWWGNYLGFTGYYNPFTGEAQVNTTVPKFILPYTTVHEMAHQLGYAREDEANFVGYLAATLSTDTLFHYSTYLDLFTYANREVFFIDSSSAKAAARQLLPEVKADILEWRKFLRAHRSPVETVISWLYGNYLKANQQPKGMATYDEVIGNLIAFYKKYGRI